MPMSQGDLDKVKTLFETVGRVCALDFQKRAAAHMRKLAREAGIATNNAGYAALMEGAEEIERMEAVESK